MGLLGWCGRDTARMACFQVVCEFALFLHAGCSTIVNSGHLSRVKVQSVPTNAKIFVDDKEFGKTPCEIVIPGPSRKVTIRLTKDGYCDAQYEVEKRVDPWVWGNVPLAIFPIAAGIGFGIDAYGGNWYRYNPPSLEAELQPSENPIRKGCHTSETPPEEGSQPSPDIPHENLFEENAEENPTPSDNDPSAPPEEDLGDDEEDPVFDFLKGTNQ